ncbi:MAG: RcpC/CpaB family pilus assembly protein [Actinomycetota bacterium]
MDVPHAATLTRPTWINARTLLGLLLFSLSFLLGHRLLSTGKTTHEMWAATRDLPTDHALTRGDLRVAEVRLPDDLRGAYVGAARDLEGDVVTRAVRAGELIPAGWLAPEAAGASARSITIPVTPEHAVGSALRPGDRIDVLATFDGGDATARTVLLVRSVEITALVTASTFTLDDEASVGVTVSVTPDDALRIAHAVRIAQIDIVRVDGTGSSASADSVTTEDFR